MRKLQIAALGAALVVGLGSTAAAQATTPPTASAQDTTAKQHGHRQGKASREEMSARRDSVLFKGINLSSAQKSQIKAIRDKYRPQFQSLRSQAGTPGSGQRPDSATRAQARSLMQQQSKEVRGVLTADQQKTYDQNVASARSQMHARMKEHGMGAKDSAKKAGPR